MQYAARKYFVSIEVLNQELIPDDKPVLLLPNHRSAFMDPVVVAIKTKRTTFFLARGESFRNRLSAWIFKQLKMIPIYRKDFDPEGTSQNQMIFENCYKLMERKGCLMIFPEGVCQTKFILSPLKVGSARIALESEARNDFELDVHLIPIGINYTNPHRFRGKVTINIGEPIRAVDYKQAYANNAWNAVDRLTADLEVRLKDLIITLDDQDEIETIAQIEYLTEDRDDVLSSESWYDKRVKINNLVQLVKKNRKKEYVRFQTKLHQLFGALDRLHLNKELQLSGNRFRNSLGFPARTALLILGLPLFLIGIVLHIVPFVLTMIIAKLAVKRVDFMGSVLFVMGLLIFTVIGLGQSYLVYHWSNSLYVTLAFAFVWPPLGLFTYGYLSDSVYWVDQLKWLRLGVRRAELRSILRTEREELIEQLRRFETEFTAN